MTNETNNTMEKAILAGGCFWGMEHLIQKLPGVFSTRVGYTGGHTTNPKYKDICTGQTGHAEAVEVTYDGTKLAYRDLLEFFFQIHDPSTKDQQGNDKGTQYRSAIFTFNENQARVARTVIQDIELSGIWPTPITTQIAPAGEFYEAEDDHQDYLIKNPGGYTCHFIRPNWTLEQKKQASGFS